MESNKDSSVEQNITHIMSGNGAGCYENDYGKEIDFNLEDECWNDQSDLLSGPKIVCVSSKPSVRSKVQGQPISKIDSLRYMESINSSEMRAYLGHA